MVTPMFLGVVAVLKGTEGLSEGLKDSKAASFHELDRLYGEAEAASLSHLYVYGLDSTVIGFENMYLCLYKQRQTS
jgi:hypothetical protein